MSCSNIRSSGSHIRGTNGTSNGIVPMLQVFNHTSRYVNQSGKRPGTFATLAAMRGELPLACRACALVTRASAV